MAVVTLSFVHTESDLNNRPKIQEKGVLVPMPARATSSKPQSVGLRNRQTAAGTPASSRRSRFVRVAPKRVRKAIYALRLVGRMGGGNYRPTKEEVEKIVNAIEKEVADMKRKLSGETEAKAIEFEL